MMRFAAHTFTGARLGPALRRVLGHVGGQGRVTAVALSLVAGLALPQGAGAQDSQTLADIRQEMSVLFVEVQRLRRELSTTGAPGVTVPGGSVIDRVNVIETELQRLTGKSEELEFRINSIVTDGTNRLGDLEFRLCELETNCDISPTQQDGGTSTTPTTELAVGERADFERASEALANGDFRSAADLFATFNETYPGGPLSAEADLKRGQALAQLDDIRGAARAYLSAFTNDQTGPNAPEALYRLGEALGRLGQTQEACTTLQEVGMRFPQSGSVSSAQEARARLGCQ